MQIQVLTLQPKCFGMFCGPGKYADLSSDLAAQVFWYVFVAQALASPLWILLCCPRYASRMQLVQERREENNVLPFALRLKDARDPGCLAADPIRLNHFH